MRLGLTYKIDGYLTPVCYCDNVDEWLFVEKIKSIANVDNVYGWCAYDEVAQAVFISCALGIKELTVDAAISFLDKFVENKKIVPKEARDFLKVFKEQQKVLPFIGKNEKLYLDKAYATVKEYKEEIAHLEELEKNDAYQENIHTAATTWKTTFKTILVEQKAKQNIYKKEEDTQEESTEISASINYKNNKL